MRIRGIRRWGDVAVHVIRGNSERGKMLIEKATIEDMHAKAGLPQSYEAEYNKLLDELVEKVGSFFSLTPSFLI